MQMREATPADAALMAAGVIEGFDSYRAWAPPGWVPPYLGAASEQRLAAMLHRDDVWALLAADSGETAGHVALSPLTHEDPAPAPPGQVNLWQLFVRERWRGSGLAGELVAATRREAARRGYHTVRLWTPRGAARARRFYEREGWTASGRENARSPSGLVTVEYRWRAPAGGEA